MKVIYHKREGGRNHRGIYKKLFFSFSLSFCDEHKSFAFEYNLRENSCPELPLQIPRFFFSWSDSFQLDALRVWLALKLLCCIFIETCQIDTNCLFRFIVFFLLFAKLFLVICDCSIKEVWDEIIASHFLWEFNFLWVN